MVSSLHWLTLNVCTLNFDSGSIRKINKTIRNTFILGFAEKSNSNVNLEFKFAITNRWHYKYYLLSKNRVTCPTLCCTKIFDHQKTQRFVNFVITFNGSLTSQKNIPICLKKRFKR